MRSETVTRRAETARRLVLHRVPLLTAYPAILDRIAEYVAGVAFRDLYSWSIGRGGNSIRLCGLSTLYRRFFNRL